MIFDRISHLIIGLSVICIVLTVIAIGAQAEEEILPQPQAIPNEVISAGNPVYDIISRQLNAISKRDADTAWATMTEKLHEKHETAGEFFSYLRLRLRPVYNHDGFKFLEQNDTEEGYIQRVEIDEHNGKPVTVIYRIKRQDDEAVLIDSFAVLDFDSEPI